MTNEFNDCIDIYEPIDLCACYEPIIEAPQELIDEWKAVRNAERKKSHGVPTFYAEDEYGTLYFYHGKNRIRVAEHFNNSGKPIGALIEDMIRFSAAHPKMKATEN